jgi:hypothetical protein
MKSRIASFGNGTSEGLSVRAARLVIWSLVIIVLTLLSCGRGEEQSAEDELKARLDRMRSLPYTSVTDHKASGDLSGVVVYDRERAWPGYNLIFDRLQTRAAFLDMEGNVIHQWSDIQMGERGWQHGIFLENGDVVTFGYPTGPSGFPLRRG